MKHNKFVIAIVFDVDGLSPSKRRAVRRRLRATDDIGSKVTEDGCDLRPVSLDDCDTNDVLRAVEDLAAAVRRARASAHHRRRDDDGGADGDAQPGGEPL